MMLAAMLSVVWLSGSEGPSAVVDAPNLTGRVVESRYDGTNDYLTIYLTHDLDRAPSVAVDYLAKFATNTVYGTWLGGWTNKVDVGATGITTSDYVQDGLVAMFDGIENAGPGIHNDRTIHTWKNLVGNVDAVLTWGSDPQTTDKSVKFVRNTVSTFKIGSQFNRPNQLTVEACHAAKGWGTYSTRALGIESGSAGFQNDAFSVGKPAASYYNAISFSYSTGIQTVTGRVGDYMEVFVDGAFHRRGDNTSAGIRWNTDYMTISGDLGQETSGGLDGEIYCIRVYDRPITDDEIAANYAIDRERFVLGHAYRAKYADCRILVVRRPIGLRSADARPSLRVSYGSATVPFAVRGVDIIVNSNAVEIVDGILRKKGN